MTDNREQEIRTRHNYASKRAKAFKCWWVAVSSSDLIEQIHQDRGWLLAALDEARATVARLENEMACREEESG